MRKGLLLLPVLCCLAVTPATAREVAGIRLPEQVQVADHDTPLILNGAGVLQQFFQDIYVGALYLTERDRRVPSIINSSAPKCIVMHVLREQLDANTLHSTMVSNIEDNLSPAEQQRIAADMQQVRQFMRDVKKGDVIRIEYLPGVGTRLWINATLQGSIKGEAFYQAMLKIWLGDDPADWGLKLALLGER